MNILFYRYNSICEPDILDAFAQLGYSIHTIDVEITRKDLSPKETLTLVHQELSKHSYDFVFTVNFYPVISEVCNIHQIRYLCWIVDSPVLELYSHSIANPWNRIFLFDSALYNDFSKYNPNGIFYLPLACNVASKHSAIQAATKTMCQKFSHKISFVGSLYSEKNPYVYLKHTSEYMKGYLDSLMEAQLKIYGTYFIDEMITDKIIDYFNENLERHYEFPEKSYADYKALIGQFYIGTNMTVLERTRFLDTLSQKMDVDLYTFSDTSMLPKIRNHGSANSTTEMPVIFHNSQINLNLTSKPIRNGVSLRVWDILGCEGFLLTNYQNDLFLHLQPDTHLAVYTSEEDFLEKVDYYGTHPQLCREIAHNGYEYVKEHHTYVIRCEEMLQLAF